MARINSYRLGIALVTLSALVWSTAGLFTRLSSSDTPTMLLWRGLSGSLAFFLYILAMERVNALRRLLNMGWHSVGYAVLGAAAMQAFIASFRFTSVAHVAVIYAMVPFAAGGLGYIFLKERMSKTAMAASFAAICGVVVMVSFGSGEGRWTGDLLAVVMTFLMAGLIVMARKFPDIDLLSAACLSTLISAAISLPWASHVIPSPMELLILAAFGSVSMALGFILFAYGSRLLPPAETALIGALDAPLAPIWVWVFFNEVPAQATLIGGGIVFAAVMAHIVLQTRSSRKLTPDAVPT
jgi:drug/metabolite transporter (DMT)-like permease